MGNTYTANTSIQDTKLPCVIWRAQMRTKSHATGQMSLHNPVTLVLNACSKHSLLANMHMSQQTRQAFSFSVFCCHSSKEVHVKNTSGLNEYTADDLLSATGYVLKPKCKKVHTACFETGR